MKSEIPTGEFHKDLEWLLSPLPDSESEIPIPAFFEMNYRLNASFPHFHFESKTEELLHYVYWWLKNTHHNASPSPVQPASILERGWEVLLEINIQHHDLPDPFYLNWAETLFLKYEAKRSVSLARENAAELISLLAFCHLEGTTTLGFPIHPRRAKAICSQPLQLPLTPLLTLHLLHHASRINWSNFQDLLDDCRINHARIFCEYLADPKPIFKYFGKEMIDCFIESYSSTTADSKFLENLEQNEARQSARSFVENLRLGNLITKDFLLIVDAAEDESDSLERLAHDMGGADKLRAYPRPRSLDFQTTPQLTTVVGYPKAELGLGEDCRMTSLSLIRQNESINIFNLHTESRQHPQKENLVEEYILDKTGDILIVNSPLPSAFIQYLDKGKTFFQDKYWIGFCPWEFNQWPRLHDYASLLYDEIWAPTQFIQDAFKKFSTRIPVLHMPLGVELPSFAKRSRSSFNLPEKDFLFYFAFDFNSSLHRKNPLALIDAFEAAFPKKSPVGLVLKCMYTADKNPLWQKILDRIQSNPRIYLIDQVLEKPALLALHANMDVFVSLHRSEGFGRLLAESFLLEVPVICTGYSGNMDFCSSANAEIVAFDLTQVQPGEYIYAEGLTWASPNHDSAVESLRKVYRDYAAAKIQAQTGKQLILRNHSLERVGKMYKDRLNQLRGLS